MLLSFCELVVWSDTFISATLGDKVVSYECNLTVFSEQINGKLIGHFWDVLLWLVVIILSDKVTLYCTGHIVDL